jgi:preprotein translocase subunit SecE
VKIEDSDLEQGPENIKATSEAPLGADEALNEEDDARARSLQLGGGGLNLGGFGKYTKFLSDVREELRKVTWPTRKMVVTETIVVLVVLVFFTLLITGLDQVYSFGFNKFLFNQ